MKFKPTAITVALTVVLSLGTAIAGGSTGSSSTSGGGSGSSASGGGSAGTVQPGTGTRKSPNSDKASTLAKNDREFIIKAAEGGMHEVEVSKLAASKASDPAVKSFANMLVDDHTKANDELKQLASSKGVELPAAPPKSKRSEAEKLGKMEGTKFDQEYLKEVGVKDHQKDIKDFEKASKDAKDPELKAWVDKTLPKLKEHLAQAQKLPSSKG